MSERGKLVWARGSTKSTWVPIISDDETEVVWMNLLTGDIITSDLTPSLKLLEKRILADYIEEKGKNKTNDEKSNG